MNRGTNSINIPIEEKYRRKKDEWTIKEILDLFQNKGVTDHVLKYVGNYDILIIYVFILVLNLVHIKYFIDSMYRRCFYLFPRYIPTGTKVPIRLHPSSD